ncbi:YuiA family protein [Halalkalibacter alkalisediminis]|uniref:YuiA family protein n=1 Tax=Halalkalibacter alkalisediminis TaxID=935616 RepID=A0ABV6NFG9_9BACI|nr:YuiA family protein [Halalkalibacter alkalisediminis]
MNHSYTQTKAEHCPYCEGTGYFQLLLGGSETCNQCKGNGQDHQSK